MPAEIEVLFNWSDRLAVDIHDAKHSVLITALSLHPPRSDKPTRIYALWCAIEAAAARGVLVEFILPAPAKAHPATAFNSAAGQKLHEIGATVHHLNPARLLHAKTTTIDNAILWVGSGNWTQAAATFNHETYIRAESPDHARKVREHWRQFITLKG